VNVLESLQLPGLEGHLIVVEEALTAAVSVPDAFLSQVAGHLVNAGGKRLRPALVVAAALAGGSEIDSRVVAGAVAVELVHLGSLYHDDVIDEAAQRRGVDSVNARWGNLVAILAGDFLLARASEIAASLGTEVAALLANTIGRLCQGEVAQLEYAFDPGRSEEAYLRAIGGKTASLLATSCRIGSLVSEMPRPWVDALTEFGRAFGMAFQIWDDIRDLVSSEDLLGKPAGHDMVEGTYTLPVIRALAVPGVGPELRALLGGELDDPARDKARNLIVSTDAVRAASTEGRRWAARAEAALEPLRAGGAPSETLTSLGELGHRLLDDLEIC
jgi:heptaprenyl diphosphate synthase